MTIPLLQLCPLLPALQRELESRYEVLRAFDDPAREAVAAARGGELRAVVTGGHVGIPSALLQRLPALQLVAINGVGYDKVDLELARSRGVRVTNTPDVLTDDVADLAVGLVIALLRRIPQGDAHVRAGRWPSGELPLARKVSSQRFGIFGLGRIGNAIARRLQGFGVAIAYAGRAPQAVPYRYVETLAQLAAESDVLIIAAAAGPSTRGIVGRDILERLGPRGALVNVARGSIVDEDELVAALSDGRLGGAALDVFANEPDVPAALRALPNVVMTPHVASATTETREAMAALVLRNLEAHFAGLPLPTPVV
ncbi:MAG TPA: 2-hydroxyacid dehydrogenase [Burkholderiaceae bacterium]|nr:2-hydroxyacid dehydrogenase [Burkholderiaceae bacterium]